MAYELRHKVRRIKPVVKKWFKNTFCTYKKIFFREVNNSWL